MILFSVQDCWDFGKSILEAAFRSADCWDFDTSILEAIWVTPDSFVGVRIEDSTRVGVS